MLYKVYNNLALNWAIMGLQAIVNSPIYNTVQKLCAVNRCLRRNPEVREAATEAKLIILGLASKEDFL